MGKRNYWVWSTSLDHSEFSLKNKVWATASEIATNKVKRGDRILFYIGKNKQTSEGEFMGICQVIGNWNVNKSGPKWPQELERKKIIWKYQCNIKIILTFKIPFKELKFLPFIREKKNPGLGVKNSSRGPANGGRPLSKSDLYALRTYLLLILD